MNVFSFILLKNGMAMLARAGGPAGAAGSGTHLLKLLGYMEGCCCRCSSRGLSPSELPADAARALGIITVTVHTDLSGVVKTFPVSDSSGESNFRDSASSFFKLFFRKRFFIEELFSRIFLIVYFPVLKF